MMMADLLLVAGALGAGLYCFVLSRRLRKFTDLEKGVGGAVAVMAVQVDDLEKSLAAAKLAATTSVETLSNVNARAEDAAIRLELLIASLHDISPQATPASTPQAQNTDPFFVRSPVDMAPTQ